LNFICGVVHSVSLLLLPHFDELMQESLCVLVLILILFVLSGKAVA
jgi:hypothetical protein